MTEEIRHTGTGRFARLRMRPMSLWESGESNGEISLGGLFSDDAEDIFSQNPLDLSKITLGGDKLIEDGAGNLKAFANLIDTTKMKAPSFLMVLTGTSPYAYRRKDGIYVVPIGCLRD